MTPEERQQKLDQMRRQVWEQRDQYDPEQYKAVAQKLGLPLQRDVPWQAEAPGVVKTEPPMEPSKASQPQRSPLEAILNAGMNAIIPVDKMANAVGLDWLANTAPGRASQAIVDHQTAVPRFMANNALQDMWSMADYLVSEFPAAVSPMGMLSKQLPEGLQDAADQFSNPFTSAMYPAKLMWDRYVADVGQDISGISQRFTDAHVAKMKQAGVEDDALGWMQGYSTLLYEGMLFAIPGQKAERTAKLSKELNYLTKAFYEGDKTAMAAMPPIVERLTKLKGVGADVLDEAIKGAQIGFYLGDGKTSDRLINSGLWATLGAAGAGAFRGLKALTRPIWSKIIPASKPALVEKLFAAGHDYEQIEFILNEAMSGSPQAQKILLQTGVLELDINEMALPAEEDIAILAERSKLITQLDNFEKPTELRIAELQQQVAADRAAAISQGLPAPEEMTTQRAMQILQEQDAQIPALRAQVNEIQASRPDLFPDKKPFDIPKSHVQKAIESHKDPLLLTLIARERGDISADEALRTLIGHEISAGNRGAAYETTQMFSRDIAGTPGKVNRYTAPMLQTAALYMQKPRGRMPGFDWGDLDVIIERALNEEGTPIYRIPWNRRTAGDGLGPRGALHSIGSRGENLVKAHKNGYQSALDQLSQQPEVTIIRRAPTVKGLLHEEDIALIVPSDYLETWGEAAPNRLDRLFEQANTELEVIMKKDSAPWAPQDVPWLSASDSSARLYNYLEYEVPWKDLEPFNPEESMYAFIDPHTKEIYGVPADLGAEVGSLADFENLLGKALGRKVTDQQHVFAQRTPEGWQTVFGPSVKKSPILDEILAAELEDLSLISGRRKTVEAQRGFLREADALVAQLDNYQGPTETDLRVMLGLEEPLPSNPIDWDADPFLRYEELKAKGIAADEAVKIVSKEFSGEASSLAPVSKSAPRRALTVPEKQVVNLPPEYVDRLTGVPNAEMTRASMRVYNKYMLSKGKEYSMFLVDIDNFKQINDIAGHIAGDRVINHFGETLRKVGGEFGLYVGRYGGDEFTLWGEIDPLLEEVVQKRIREVFRNLPENVPEVIQLLRDGAGPYIIAPAVGVIRSGKRPLKAILDLADTSMYELKRFQKATLLLQGFKQQGWKVIGPVSEGKVKIMDAAGNTFIHEKGSTELAEQIAYAKIKSNGTVVLIKPGGVKVVRPGAVPYVAENMAEVSIKESLSASPVMDEIPLPPEISLAEIEGELAPSLDINDVPSMFGDTRPAGKGEFIKYRVIPGRSMLLNIDKDYGVQSVKHYDALEKAYRQLEIVLEKAQDKLAEISKQGNKKNFSEAAQALLVPGKYQEAVLNRMGTQSRRIFTEMKKLFYDLYEDMGIPQEDWDDVLDILNRAAGNDLPVDQTYPWFDRLQPMLHSYELSGVQPTADSIYRRMFRAHNRMKLMKDASDFFKNMIKSAREHKTLPTQALLTLQRQHEMFMGLADPDLIGMTEAAAALWPNKEIARQIVPLMLSLQYSSSMSWRAGLPLRNTAQPIVTTAPMIGMKYTMKGWLRAIAYLKGKDNVFKELLTGEITEQGFKELGIIQTYTPVPAGELVRDASYARNTLGAINRFTKKGLVWQKKTDKLNRLTAFFGAAEKASVAMKKTLAKDLSWEEFAKMSDMDLLHVTDQKAFKAEFENIIKGEGDMSAFINRYAQRVADDTQFVYASYAQPRFFHGVWGKMFGQYGVFPAQYFAMIKDRMLHSTNPAKYARRLIAIHGSIAALGATTGLALNDWVFWHPAMYTGGPYLQLTAELLLGMSAPPGRKADEVSRALKDFAPQMIPLAGLYRYDIKKAAAYLERGDAPGALLAFLRLQSWPDQYDDVSSAVQTSPGG